MATDITAPTPLSRPAPRFGTLNLLILAATAVAVIGIVVGTQAGPVRDVTTESQPYGLGYPRHGGLAGPSRIGQEPTTGPLGSVSSVDLADHYGPGYPLHGGLAGPSRVDGD